MWSREMRKSRCNRAIMLLFVGVAAVARVVGQTTKYDVVIQGAHVVDGTGNPWFAADIAIKGDTITVIAPHVDPEGARVIEASGLVVSPGFIDVHSHSEKAQGLAASPLAENNVRQGVTTVFANPDGFGEVPISAFLQRVGGAHPAINVGAFIGHGAIREKVVGLENRPATRDELARMRDLVREGMQEGAFGLSTGLFYVPANFAQTEEVIQLARVAGQYGGVHESHMRDETGRVLDSVRETIAIGAQGHLPTQITHHKIIGKANWGRSVETLRLVDEARQRGVDVTIDQYPYTASNTSLEAGLVPQWAREGGRERLLARLRDPDTGARVRQEIASAIENDRGAGDPANVALAACDFDQTLGGRNLRQLLDAAHNPVTSAAAADLVVELVAKGNCTAIYHAISEDDLLRILKHPVTMIASDADPGEPVFGRDVPHPRAYGTFARVLAVYVREQHALSLEDAVRKMSSFPAMRMRLTDRGVLRPGMKADVVAFDAATIKDNATFEDPHRYATGVRAVLVNGEVVFQNGRMTGARPGRVLRGPGFVTSKVK
jgi:N-acyl-D-amino-acid deacylase